MRSRAKGTRRGLVGPGAPEPGGGDSEFGKGAGGCAPGIADPRSTYCTGYCTWYAWQRRPESQLRGLGHAYTWLPRARSRGIPTGTTPAVGAIAWWDERNGDGYGHVAYVEAVGAGTVTVAEMNVEGWSKTSRRVIPLGTARAPHGYIYGGPTGNGPGSQPAPGGAPALPPAPFGKRIGVLLNDGTAHVKEGPLDAPWVAETGPDVKLLVLSGNRIGVLLNNGTAVVKEGPLDAQWVPETGPDIKQLALSGDRIGVLDTSGRVFVKDGPLDAQWIAETGPDVKQLALSGDRIGVLLNNGTALVKEGPLDAQWVAETGPDVQQLALG